MSIFDRIVQYRNKKDCLNNQ